MVARLTTDIFCDICGNWEHGPVSHKPEPKLARKILKKKGWKRSRDPEGELQDVCPECQEK